MYPEVEKFLQKHRIAVLSIIDAEGYPHSAAMHFATNGIPFAFYFRTDKSSHKNQALVNGAEAKASVVIGFDEKEWVTMQMEGHAHIAMLPDEQQEAEILYFKKFPNAEKGGHLVTIIFKPIFWKYIDYREKPWRMMTSEDK